jgi:hypothetical protein
VWFVFLLFEWQGRFFGHVLLLVNRLRFLRHFDLFYAEIFR